ncbi:MAG: hypothetical protein GXO19_03220 [Epsilonproteobacteria bacterium]|nr:hypothetical protein [Campylobacterota bacterium]NPA56728.1 hypothetical protein [Campylobacterota bacterium]
MLKILRDKRISLSMRQLLNLAIQDVGEILYLNFDSDTHEIEMELLLHGDQEPLHLVVREYLVVEENGEHFLILKEIDGLRREDREVREYLQNKKFRIPQRLFTLWHRCETEGVRESESH